MPLSAPKVGGLRVLGFPIRRLHIRDDVFSHEVGDDRGDTDERETGDDLDQGSLEVEDAHLGTDGVPVRCVHSHWSRVACATQHVCWDAMLYVVCRPSGR